MVYENAWFSRQVESFPADYINGAPSPTASAKSREGTKKDDKKDAKKDAKGKDKGKDDKVRVCVSVRFPYL